MIKEYFFLSVSVGSVQIKGENSVFIETREGEKTRDPPFTPSPTDITV